MGAAVNDEFDPTRNGLAYSVHRWYLDSYLLAELRRLPPGTRVLDVGGHARARRGQFDLEACGHHGVYLNLSVHHGAHVQGDAHALPFRNVSFPAVLCSQLVEHVARPEQALREIARVLAPGGWLFITVPFLVAIHGDPFDFGRYTDGWWRQRLPDLGFEVERLDFLGHYFSVMADNVRVYAHQGLPGMRLHRRIVRRLIALIYPHVLRMAIRWDRDPVVVDNAALRAFTTGFGISARRVDRT